MRVKRKGLNYGIAIQSERQKKSKSQEQIDNFVPEVIKFSNKIKKRKLNTYNFMPVIFHLILNSLGYNTADELMIHRLSDFMLLRQDLYNSIMLDILRGKHTITIPDDLIKKYTQNE